MENARPWLSYCLWEENSVAQPFPEELLAKFLAKKCLVCNEDIATLTLALVHYESEEHLGKVANYMYDKYQSVGKVVLPKDNFLSDFCVPCSVTSLNRLQHLQHLSGKNHAKKLALIAKNQSLNAVKRECNDVENSPSKKSMTSLPFGDYVCSLCDVTALSKSQMELHNNGQRHQKNLTKLPAGEFKDFFMRKGNCEPVSGCFSINSTGDLPTQENCSLNELPATSEIADIQAPPSTEDSMISFDVRSPDSTLSVSGLAQQISDSSMLNNSTPRVQPLSHETEVFSNPSNPPCSTEVSSSSSINLQTPAFLSETTANPQMDNFKIDFLPGKSISGNEEIDDQNSSIDSCKDERHLESSLKGVVDDITVDQLKENSSSQDQTVDDNPYVDVNTLPNQDAYKSDDTTIAATRISLSPRSVPSCEPQAPRESLDLHAMNTVVPEIGVSDGSEQMANPVDAEPTLASPAHEHEGPSEPSELANTESELETLKAKLSVAENVQKTTESMDDEKKVEKPIEPKGGKQLEDVPLKKIENVEVKPKPTDIPLPSVSPKTTPEKTVDQSSVKDSSSVKEKTAIASAKLQKSTAGSTCKDVASERTPVNFKTQNNKADAPCKAEVGFDKVKNPDVKLPKKTPEKKNLRLNSTKSSSSSSARSRSRSPHKTEMGAKEKKTSSRIRSARSSSSRSRSRSPTNYRSEEMKKGRFSDVNSSNREKFSRYSNSNDNFQNNWNRQNRPWRGGGQWFKPFGPRFNNMRFNQPPWQGQRFGGPRMPGYWNNVPCFQGPRNQGPWFPLEQPHPPQPQSYWNMRPSMPTYWSPEIPQSNMHSKLEEPIKEERRVPIIRMERGSEDSVEEGEVDDSGRECSTDQFGREKRGDSIPGRKDSSEHESRKKKRKRKREKRSRSSSSSRPRSSRKRVEKRIRIQRKSEPGKSDTSMLVDPEKIKQRLLACHNQQNLKTNRNSDSREKEKLRRLDADASSSGTVVNSRIRDNPGKIPDSARRTNEKTIDPNLVKMLEEQKQKQMNEILMQVAMLKRRLIDAEEEKKRLIKKQKRKKSKKKKRSSSSSSSSSSTSSDSTTSSSDSSDDVKALLAKIASNDDGDKRKKDKKKSKKKKKDKKREKKKKEEYLHSDSVLVSLAQFKTPDGTFQCKPCDMVLVSHKEFLSHITSEEHKKLCELIKRKLAE